VCIRGSLSQRCRRSWKDNNVSMSYFDTAYVFHAHVECVAEDGEHRVVPRKGDRKIRIIRVNVLPRSRHLRKHQSRRSEIRKVKLTITLLIVTTVAVSTSELASPSSSSEYAFFADALPFLPRPPPCGPPFFFNFLRVRLTQRPLPAI
jgi:hypothetical protein